MAIQLGSVESTRTMRIRVANNRSLYIITGFAKFDWRKSDDERWSEDTLTIPMTMVPHVPNIPPDKWVDSTAVVSLAGFYFRESAQRDKVGFSVNSVRVVRPEILPPADFAGSDYELEVGLSILGNDARFYSVSFELSIEARD